LKAEVTGRSPQIHHSSHASSISSCQFLLLRLASERLAMNSSRRAITT